MTALLTLTKKLVLFSLFSVSFLTSVEDETSTKGKVAKPLSQQEIDRQANIYYGRKKDCSTPTDRMNTYNPHPEPLSPSRRYPSYTDRSTPGDFSGRVQQ